MYFWYQTQDYTGNLSTGACYHVQYCRNYDILSLVQNIFLLQIYARFSLRSDNLLAPAYGACMLLQGQSRSIRSIKASAWWIDNDMSKSLSTRAQQISTALQNLLFITCNYDIIQELLYDLFWGGLISYTPKVEFLKPHRRYLFGMPHDETNVTWPLMPYEKRWRRWQNWNKKGNKGSCSILTKIYWGRRLPAGIHFSS